MPSWLCFVGGDKSAPLGGSLNSCITIYTQEDQLPDIVCGAWNGIAYLKTSKFHGDRIDTNQSD